LYKLGIWIVHPQKFSIEHDGKEVKLKSLIMKLLLLFIESEGKAISKEELLEKCWHGRVVTDDAIRQAIKELRSALNSHNDNIEYIQTIRKHGYRLLPDVELITTAQETPFALFFKKHKITLIFLIAILLIATLLGFIYQNYSYRLSKDSTIITYDKKRETDYDINSEGWDAYIIIRPDFYYGESIIVRDQEKNHIHTILPSHNEGHIENVKFSPNGELLVYLDFSIENCKIRIINVK
jgi:DNA-binding winged helix-turn-helix (wHTH) protein